MRVNWELELKAGLKARWVNLGTAARERAGLGNQLNKDEQRTRNVNERWERGRINLIRWVWVWVNPDGTNWVDNQSVNININNEHQSGPIWNQSGREQLGTGSTTGNLINQSTVNLIWTINQSINTIQSTESGSELGTGWELNQLVNWSTNGWCWERAGQRNTN